MFVSAEMRSVQFHMSVKDVIEQTAGEGCSMSAGSQFLSCERL